MSNNKSKQSSSISRPGSADISLQAGRGSRPSGSGGYYWHIYTGGIRAGRVFINLIDEPPFGHHPSLQIYLNKTHQGRGIGSVAYRLACEASGYQKIYAHMRKSNIASRRAAENAGFKIINHIEIRQLSLVWRQP